MKLFANKYPKIDHRTYENLIEDFKKMAREYTPGWNFEEQSKDFGVALAKIFCEMQENTIERLNGSLYNLYLTFLQLMGLSPNPAVPAKGIVIADAVKNSKGSYVKKRSKITAESMVNGESVIFETQEDLFIADNSIEKIIMTDFENDRITIVYDSSNDFKPFHIYDCSAGVNLQFHAIYFKNDVIFNFSKTDLTFRFENRSSEKTEKEILGIFLMSKWQCFDGNEWKEAIEVTETENRGINIKFDSKPQMTQLLNETARFIRVILNVSEVDLTRITCYPSPVVSQAEEFLKGEDQLEKKEFLPFDEKYMIYDCFYIKSDEIFSKIGAKIEIKINISFVKIKTDTKNPTIKYKMIMSDIDFADMTPSDITIERVNWEYWNGKGWAKISFLNENSEKIFKAANEKEERTIKFICPEDIKERSVGAYEGMFVRARVSKINNQFDVMANYITPCISSLQINCSYDNPKEIKEIFSTSNLQTYKIEIPAECETPIILMKNIISEKPCMYLCLSNPISEGVVNIFFEIEEGVYKNKFSTRWEYWARFSDRKFGWKYLNVIDMTDGFTHSESVSIVGKNDFAKGIFFGLEGYFLKITDICKESLKARTKSLPMLRDIKFNSVKVLQNETCLPEFFEIEKGQKNKICSLSRKGASNISVWVNETGKISLKDQEKLLSAENNDAIVEYNGLGKIENIWIKWHQVNSLLSCGPYDRVCEVNFSDSKVTFGDGKNGMIPPEQYGESIKIEYSVCNGKNGNVDSYGIKDFVSVVPGASKIYNPKPLSDGLDTEALEYASYRIFTKIQGGDRLVSVADLEHAIIACDQNIHSIRCLPHFNRFSEPDIGQISISVLPEQFPCGYEKFTAIKKRIFSLLNERAPFTIFENSHVNIFEVFYVETAVRLKAVIKNLSVYQEVHKEIFDRIEKFLNPVSGNFSGNGWKISDFPRENDIRCCIKSVLGIEWIKEINIFSKMITEKGKIDIPSEELSKLNFNVPVFGGAEIYLDI
ncbi:MAG: hypothetical protein LBK29_03070 [Oscillospiraceae bacterium]|jgi:hypothetical protein|nr:hypothetical protein [Oscillospiraceae bacterium]